MLARDDTPRRLDAPLSQTVIDDIKWQIQRNWSSVPTGAEDAHEVIVILRLQLGPDGAVRKVTVVDKARMAGDAVFRAMAESAVRAVWKTKRIERLPPDTYAQWHDIKLTFNPEDMFG